MGRPLHEHGHQHECWAEEEQAASEDISNNWECKTQEPGEDVADDKEAAPLLLLSLLQALASRRQLRVTEVGQRVPAVRFSVC